MGNTTKNSQHAMSWMINDFDDPSLVANSSDSFYFLDSQKNTITDACRLPRGSFAAGRNSDFRDRATGEFVPLVRCGNEISFLVASGHAGNQCRSECAGVMQFFPAFFDQSFIRQAAKHVLEIGAKRVLESKCTRDFTRPDLPRLITDEGEEVGSGRKRRDLFGSFIQNDGPASSAQF